VKVFQKALVDKKIPPYLPLSKGGSRKRIGQNRYVFMLSFSLPLRKRRNEE
jgi:hypothetical protein